MTARIYLPTDSHLRELLGDMSAVARILAPENRNLIPTIRQFERSSRNHFYVEKAVKSIVGIVRSGKNIYLTEVARDVRGVSSRNLWCFTS